MSLLKQEYYTMEELAELLGVTTRTIRNYLKEGKIKGYKIGGRWKFSKGNIEEYIQNQKNEVLDISKIQEQGLDTCRLIFNYHIDVNHQTEFFKTVTRAFNNYEEKAAGYINCYLSCISVSEEIAEVTIAGESQHVLNLANIISEYKK